MCEGPWLTYGDGDRIFLSVVIRNIRVIRVIRGPSVFSGTIAGVLLEIQTSQLRMKEFRVSQAVRAFPYPGYRHFPLPP